MARTIRTKVYKFNELNQTAQQVVIENNHDINVNYEWWETTYMDAENIGLKIKSFDIDRNSYCKGTFNLSPCEVAANITLTHGEKCETYLTAISFLDQWNPVFSEYLNEESEKYESSESESIMQDLEEEFLKSLCEDYRIILANEYEYLTGKDAIIETIVSNEYEFTIDGKRF
jgi:hypothetical protein